MSLAFGPEDYQKLFNPKAYLEMYFRLAGDIIVSDFTDSNREAFKDWLLERPEAFDWSPIVKLVCQLEGDRTPWKEKEARLRKTIKLVAKCNILKSPPIEEAVLQADCILSCFCLESACKDHKDYVAALHHMTSLLKPGGYLVLAGSMGSTYYTVGDVKFSGLILTEPFVRKSLAGYGFTIVNLEFSNKREESSDDVADFSAFYVLVAKKNE
ncbi:nicotinamide N-methyltransferase-like [Gastrophryne carolinensis]